MLYDTKWDAKTKPEAFSLRGFISWLETKPADDEYCYLSNGACVTAQYLLSLGYQKVGVDDRGFYDHGSDNELWTNLPCAFGAIARGHPRTFGAALYRARKLARR